MIVENKILNTLIEIVLCLVSAIASHYYVTYFVSAPNVVAIALLLFFGLTGSKTKGGASTILYFTLYSVCCAFFVYVFNSILY